MLLRAELGRFTVVGAIGFAVEAAVLHALVSKAGWSPFAARLVSFPLAVSATFLLNGAWTFRAALRTRALRAFGGYTAIQAIGAMLNFLVYMGLLAVFDRLHGMPVLALALGSAVALVFNFGASRRLVFRT